MCHQLCALYNRVCVYRKYFGTESLKFGDTACHVCQSRYRFEVLGRGGEALRLTSSETARNGESQCHRGVQMLQRTVRFWADVCWDAVHAVRVAQCFSPPPGKLRLFLSDGQIELLGGLELVHLLALQFLCSLPSNGTNEQRLQVWAIGAAERCIDQAKLVMETKPSQSFVLRKLKDRHDQ